MTITAQDLLNRLQLFQRTSNVYKEIFTADAELINQRQDSIDDIISNLSVNTATWGLEIYEKQLGITTDTSKTFQERREVIISKSRGIGTVNAALIKNVANAFTGGTIDLGFDNGTVTITFTDITGIPTNIDDLKQNLRSIVPAHLSINYVLKYNRWNQAATKTWNQLSAYTWDQVMQGNIF